MGNIQQVWILYGVLSSISLDADEQMTAAERNWTINESEELNQPRGFTDILRISGIQKIYCIEGEVMPSFPQEIKDSGCLQD